MLVRLLVYTHRWLGIALGALFAGWFISGVVMMYVGMPRLDPAKRLARQPALDFSTARLAPADALTAAGAAAPPTPLDRVDLTMLRGRPLYRFQSGRQVVSAFADTGERLAPLSEQQALDEARRFSPDHAGSARYEGLLRTPDQWTLEFARQLPMHRIALGDQADTRLYVSATTGDIVLETTATTRLWAYPGAILHWLYLTPLRRHGELWAQIIIWTSLAGTVMCGAGLVWGVWRLSPSRRFRLRRQPSASPYAGWMAWHHYAGLLFGVVSLTWVFSGLLSMDPWDWHPSTSPTRQQRSAFAGGAYAIDTVSVEQLADAVSRLPGTRVAELVQSAGSHWLAGEGHTVALATDRGGAPLDRAAVTRLAALAMPGSPILDVAWLDGYDAYYYDRSGDLPLPVVRIRYADDVRTWLYVNPARGAVVRKEERLTRLNRWLYHGLHSLDVPFLYYRRPLWDAVVIVLSLGGFVLTLTTLVPAVRRLRRHARRAGG